MKNIKSILAVILAVVMLFCIAGCEKAAGTDKAETIVGSWVCEMDITEYMNDYMGDAGFDGIDFGNTPLCVYLVFDFEDDGTCVLYADEDATIESMKVYVEDLLDAFLEYAYELYEEEYDMSRSEVDDYFEENAGVTLEEYFDEAMAEYITPEALAESVSGFETQEGYYRLDGNKLYIADTEDELADEEEYVLCELSKGKMTINAGSDEDIFEEFEEMGIELPLVFKKK